MVFLALTESCCVLSVNTLPHSFLSFGSPLLLVRVLQRELQFGPELGLSAAQSLEQQTRLLPQLLQLPLGAFVLLNELLCAHGDAQQSRLVENVVGIAKSFPFARVHRGILVVIHLICPAFICIGGQRAVACQEGERTLLKFRHLWLVACWFGVAAGFVRSL